MLSDVACMHALHAIDALPTTYHTTSPIRPINQPTIQPSYLPTYPTYQVLLEAMTTTGPDHHATLMARAAAWQHQQSQRHRPNGLWQQQWSYCNYQGAGTATSTGSMHHGSLPVAGSRSYNDGGIAAFGGGHGRANEQEASSSNRLLACLVRARCSVLVVCTADRVAGSGPQCTTDLVVMTPYLHTAMPIVPCGDTYKYLRLNMHIFCVQGSSSSN